MYNWLFPPVKNRGEGVKKVMEEYSEFIEAAGEYNEDMSDVNKRLHVTEEALDVIHAIETYLRGIGITDAAFSDSVLFVKLKNKLRGYYDNN